MSSWNRFLILAILALMVGCASFGPIGTSEFEPALRRDIPSVEGSLLYHAPASLLYGVNGYDLMDNVAIRAANTSGRDTISGQGIVIIFDKHLYFVRWIQGKYVADWDTDLKRVISVEFRTLGRGRRVVLQLNLDESPVHVSFSASTDNGQFIDQERTEAVCQVIATQSGLECKHS